MRNAWLLVLIACQGGDDDDRTSLPVTTADTDTDTDADTDSDTDTDTDPYVPLEDTAAEPVTRFAVIGDFGEDNDDEEAVAELIKSWGVDFVITLGDNNYPSGAAETIDENVGKYFADFIYPYTGTYGSTATENRFWPSLGNHDWYTDDAQPYLDYFTLPGNERYYELVEGPVHLFAVDGDMHEPDGVDPDSVQGTWLRDALLASAAPFQMVYMHHAPYASGTHGPTEYMQWPYAAWGADLVLAGHEHHYEWLVVDGVPYLVNGIGGTYIRSMSAPIEGSQLAWTAKHGATLVEAYDDHAVLTTFSVDGDYVDKVRLEAGLVPSPTQRLVHDRSLWRVLDTGVAPADAWTGSGFDDSAWTELWAPVGYGHAEILGEADDGPDSLDRHPTTWLRQTFTVDDPLAWGALSLRLKQDAGAVVYLNGVEVHRANLPSPSDPTTVASSEPDLPLLWETVALDPTLLLLGDNVVAVELHHSAADDADLLLDLALEATRTDRLVASGASWSFLDTGIAPAADWRDLGFDDAAWAEAPAPLGYGGAEASTVSYGADDADKHRTLWLRHAFDVTDASTVEQLLLRVAAEDGVVVYLNGVALHRHLVPGGALSDQALAAAEAEDGWETLWHDTFVESGLLVDGTNVLAAEVHLADPGSDTLFFDLELVPF